MKLVVKDKKMRAKTLGRIFLYDMALKQCNEECLVIMILEQGNPHFFRAGVV